MIISLIGGTGDLGRGLAFRLKLAGYNVVIGSRRKEKAEAIAEKCNEIVRKLGGNANIAGLSNEKAAEISDISILTIPWKHVFETAEKLRDKLKNKIVVSPVVPMKLREGRYEYTPPEEGSAALKLAKILNESRIVVAFNNIPAKRFADTNEILDWDVIVCSDDDHAKKTVMEIISNIEGLRALDGGSLKNSAIVEALTPLLINISRKNSLNDACIKFV